MKKKGFLFWSILIITLIFVVSCTSTTGDTQNYGSWSFSGTVLDGYTSKELKTVTITYRDSDGNVQKSLVDTLGSFYIKDLPFGDRSFNFKYSIDGIYTEKNIVVGGWTEATTLDGDIGELTKIVELYPLNASISGALLLQVDTNEVISMDSGTIAFDYTDTGAESSLPSRFTVVSDSMGVFTFSGVPAIEKGRISILPYTYEGITYGIQDISIPNLHSNDTHTVGIIYLEAIDSGSIIENQIKSNVLSSNGIGLQNISVTTNPYYILPIIPVDSTVEARILGTTDTLVNVSVSEDTVTIIPNKNFDYNVDISVYISCVDSEGVAYTYEMTDEKAFHTEKDLFITTSNYMDETGVIYKNYIPGDTIRVEFSKNLQSDVSTIIWHGNDVNGTIFGSGENINAAVQIDSNALTLVPDQRLEINYGDSIGFQASFLTAEGKRSSSLSFYIKVIDDNLKVVWTNTKNHLGQVREDLGLMDSIILVSNQPIEKVIGLSSIAGELTPPDLTLDNVKIVGSDTIIYYSSIFMEPDTTYGLSFDLQLAGGIKRYNVLPVTWKAKNSCRILSTNNRENGKFRTFKSLGDSLIVEFAEPIDISPTASVPFRVRMVDVNQTAIKSIVTWNATQTVATIKNIQSLPTADYSPSVDYGLNSVYSRSVQNVSFDFVTIDGEVARYLTPSNERLEIHSESGLCATGSNLLVYNNYDEEINIGSKTVNNFGVDSIIRITFNKPVDSSEIVIAAQKYFGIVKKGTSDTIASHISFDSTATEVRIYPDTSLDSVSEYYVYLKDVPGLSISNSTAVHYHGGRYSGSALYDRLVTAPFMTGN